MNKLQEIFKAWNIAFDPDKEQNELAGKRIAICNDCEYKVTNLGINRCSVCGCALKGKVFSPIRGACPKGKWNKIDEVVPSVPETLKIEDSKETIFVQIASYRDPELTRTLDDLFIQADNPNNLKVCIAWQHAEEDIWDNLDNYKNDSRIKILNIPYDKAKGACWARNMIQGEYGNETYTLQLDSHHRFIKGWDTELISMYKGLKADGVNKPLITGYLPSYDPKNEPAGRLQEVWKMDFNRFTPEGYIFVYPSVVEGWETLEKPIPTRFFSAHFTFTSGDFCLNVPHDPHMYFHGEEPSLASRAYTHGYDLFHPHKIIGWHEYTRDGKKKHWDDDDSWSGKNNHSHLRFRVLHKMENVSPEEVPNLDIYGFGTTRTLEDYEKYAGLRYRDKKVQQYTLDFKYPPNPVVEDYEASLLSKVKHCIDIHKDHFKHNDYEFWVVSFEMEDGRVIFREDLNAVEVKAVLKTGEKDGWVRIWKDFIGEHPDKWVVWPYSKENEYVERIEGSLRG